MGRKERREKREIEAYDDDDMMMMMSGACAGIDGDDGSRGRNVTYLPTIDIIIIYLSIYL